MLIQSAAIVQPVSLREQVILTAGYTTTAFGYPGDSFDVILGYNLDPKPEYLMDSETQGR
jgi:hypothetical protein